MHPVEKMNLHQCFLIQYLALLMFVAHVSNSLIKSLQPYFCFLKICIWPVVLYGHDTWTMNKGDVKCMRGFEKWRYWRLTSASQIEKVTNESVLENVMEKNCRLEIIQIRRLSWLGLILRDEEIPGECWRVGYWAREVGGDQERHFKR